MLKWTGERYLPFVKPNTCGAEIHYEHLHRYAFACQFVSGKKIMDLACGEGYGSYILSKEADHVTGIDIDYNTIVHAAYKYQVENLEFLQGSICEIPIEGEKIYDVIISFEAIEHIDKEEQKKFLIEVKRLLKEEGLFIVSSPNKALYSDEPVYQNQYHKKELYYNEFESLLKNYFSNITFFGQKVYCGSNIWQLLSKKIHKSVNFTIEKNKEIFTFVEDNYKNPLYYIAVASNKKIKELDNISSSLVDESDILLKQGTTYIEELEQRIIEQENDIHGIKQEAVERENAIHELKQEAVERENTIHEFKKSISDYENKVKEFNEQITYLNRKSQELENENSEMKRSMLFKLATSFHGGFVERVFPTNTKRRKLYDTGLQSGRSLVNKGLESLRMDISKDNKQKEEVTETKDEEKIRNMKFNEKGINITISKNLGKNKFSELAAKYIRGKGIQIGPRGRSFDIPSNASITHIDSFCIIYTNESSVGKGGHDHSESMPVQLHPFDKKQGFDDSKDEQFDFCIVTDIIEQATNSEKLITDCLNILKPGGILYLIFSEGIYKTNEIMGSQNNIKTENLDNHKANYQSRKYVVENILDQLRLKEPDLLKVIDYVDNEIDGKKLYALVIEKNHYVKKIFERLMAKKTNQSDDIGLDVIIPVYNAYEDLIRCLQSVLIHQEGSRIILINDKSTDPKIKDLFLKLKPFEFKNLVLLENSENQGFVKTVNRGMKFSKKDVILLNSDTVVTENWIRKLRECANTDYKIGTVTPFTNNGTICSIPDFCEVNEVPIGFSIESFADFIEKISFKTYPAIPTAVGFCMYIKREVLDKIGYFDQETFGKGYGEENDFCMRAIYAGYKNVLCDNTFIFHRGEASFSASKSLLIKKNLDTLSRMYPEYFPTVSQFINSNRLKKLNKNIHLRIKTWDVSKKRIMYILHTWGGGTESHVQDLIQKLNKEYKLYVLQVINNEIILTEINNNNSLKYAFLMNSQMNKLEFHNEVYEKIVSSIIDTFQIDLIHVHHLIGHTFDIFNIAKIRNIPIVFSIHDFYSVCPRINLINYNDEHCHGKNNLTECEMCLRKLGLKSNFITKWRNHFTDIFEITALLITPTKSTLDILSIYYPNIVGKSKVIEHGHDNELLLCKGMIKKSKDIHNRIIHIAFIGGLSLVKGRKIFYDLAYSKKLRGKTKWSIFGVSDIHFESGIIGIPM